MRRTPTDFSPYQLKKVGASIVRNNPKRLRCDRCGQEWSIKGGGLRMPKGYWRCPNGCNATPLISPERSVNA